MINIDEVIAKTRNARFAKPYLYRIFFDDERVSLNASNVTLPGITFGIAREKHYGTGLAHSFPINKEFSDVSIQFYCSEDQHEKKYFEDWADRIWNRVTNRTNYYNEYVQDILIEQYNTKNESTARVKLLEAFPSVTGGLTLDYSSTNSLMTFTVAFQFYDYEFVNSFQNTDENGNVIEVSNAQLDRVYEFSQLINNDESVAMTENIPNRPLTRNYNRNE